METYSLAQLSEETLRSLVTLHIQVGISNEWETMQKGSLTPAERAQIDYLKSILRERDLVVMNEATLWGACDLPFAGACRARLHSSVDRHLSESELPDFSIGR